MKIMTREIHVFWFKFVKWTIVFTYKTVSIHRIFLRRLR